MSVKAGLLEVDCTLLKQLLGIEGEINIVDAAGATNVDATRPRNSIVLRLVGSDRSLLPRLRVGESIPFVTLEDLQGAPA